MKQILLFAFSLLFASAFAARPITMQSIRSSSNFILGTDTLELYDTTGNKINNLTVTYSVTNPAIDILSGYIWVKNTTGTDMTHAFVHRTVNHQVDSTTNSFCFGINCYGPMTDESTYAATLAAGAMDKSFLADYQPGGHGGLTSVTYEFFDNLTFGKQVSAKATILFLISGVGIDEARAVFKGLYPNPASQTAYLDCNIPVSMKSAQLIIRNILGVEVEHINIENRSGKTAVDVSQYASGIYFYSVVVDGKVVLSKKLIVKN